MVWQNWPLVVLAGLAGLGAARGDSVVLGAALGLPLVTVAGCLLWPRRWKLLAEARPVPHLPTRLARLAAAVLLQPSAVRNAVGLGLLTACGIGLVYSALDRSAAGAVLAMACSAVAQALVLFLYQALRKSPPGWRAAGAWLGFGLVVATAAAVGLWLRNSQAEPLLTAATLLVLAGWVFLYLLSKPVDDDGLPACMLACVLVGAALAWVLPVPARPLTILVPAVLFWLVQNRWLRPLHALQLSLAALAHEAKGEVPEALQRWHQAGQLYRSASWVQAGLARVLRRLDPSQYRDNPQIMELVDAAHCWRRTEEILLRRPPPGPDLLAEARRLLALALVREPLRQPEADYWLTVAALHGGEHEEAARLLLHLLDDRAARPEHQDSRAAVLARGWELALWLHPQMVTRVGQPLLAAGRRFDALAAAEETLRRRPGDPVAIQIKHRLYPEVTLAEYAQEAGQDPRFAASRFDHAFCAEVARSLLGDATRWRHGIDLLRVAARGLPADAPLLLDEARQVAERRADAALAEALAEEIKKAGLRHGVQHLSDAARQVWWRVVKVLADAALARDERPVALALLRLYADAPQAGAETQRLIADLCVQEGDIVGALIANARCLVYDAQRPDHLALRDRCYYALTPELVRKEWERLRSAFDIRYCQTRARDLLDMPGSGPVQAAWAEKLTRLALTAEPGDVSAQVLLGRSLLAQGQPDAGFAALCEAFHRGRGQTLTGESREDWYLACRLLGDHYLGTGRLAEAIVCLTEFRKSSRSGANTLFKLAQAHEQLGQLDQARQWYEHVTYYNQPLAASAKEALARLKASR